MAPSNYSIQIRKRPWWQWALAVVWLLLVLFFANTAIASGAEMQPQAATFAYIVTILLIIIGVAGYANDRRKAK